MTLEVKNVHYAAGNIWSGEVATGGSKEGAGFPLRVQRSSLWSYTPRRCAAETVGL